MNISRTALIVASIIIVLLAGLAGGLAYAYYFNTDIVRSPLVTNETKLKEYLGIRGIFSKLLKYKSGNGQHLNVNSILFFPHNKWKETDNCTGTRETGIIFCFDESLSKGQMTINVYPDPSQISKTDMGTVNQLLNLNLLVILEEKLGISPNKKSLILTENQNDFAFTW